MATIQPQGENIRQAVKWISAELVEDPGKRVQKLIQEAAQRFNLSPLERSTWFLFTEKKRSEDSEINALGAFHVLIEDPEQTEEYEEHHGNAKGPCEDRNPGPGPDLVMDADPNEEGSQKQGACGHHTTQQKEKPIPRVFHRKVFRKGYADPSLSFLRRKSTWFFTITSPSSSAPSPHRHREPWSGCV